MFPHALLLALLAVLGGCHFDGYRLVDEVGPVEHARAFARQQLIQQTPPPTPTTEPTLPNQPTTFDPSICSAYPELCRNAGILPTGP
jgi:hypothetical protein